MAKKEAIRSELSFFLSLIKDILLFPIILILVLFKQKKPSDLLTIPKNVWRYMTEVRFTWTIILLNIALFVAVRFFLGAGLMGEGLYDRLFIWSPSDLFSGQFVALLGSLFMHADVLHLVSNMIALFIFGRVVEKHFHVSKTALIYFGSGLIAHIFTTIIYLIQSQNIGGLGASGAIMGLVSTAILIKPFYISFNALVPLPIMVLGWLAIIADVTGIMSAANDGIGHLAHLGGFLAIACIVFFLDKKEKEQLKKGLLINVVSALIVVSLWFFFIRTGELAIPSL